MSNFKEHRSRDGKRSRYEYRPAELGRMTAIAIVHRDGGVNQMSSRSEKRGIEITMKIVERERSESGVVFETYDLIADTNVRHLVLETPRYSAKKLEAVARAMNDKAPDLAAAWLDDRETGLEMLRDVVREVARAA